MAKQFKLTVEKREVEGRQALRALRNKLKIPGELHLGTWKIKTKLIDLPNNSNPDS